MTQVSRTLLTEAQTMALAAIAATAATPRPSGETRDEHVARIVGGIWLQLHDPSIDTGGTWRLAWLGLTPDNANMACIVRNHDGSNQFAVVVRGTVDSPVDMMEDLDVGTLVPFTAAGSAAPVAVSAGAMAAFTEIANARGFIGGTPTEEAPEGEAPVGKVLVGKVPVGESGRPGPALPSRVTLREALAALLAAAPSTPRPVVHVTGHSLGGCVATMLAPYLQAQDWAPSEPQFGLVTFAAPTAGPLDFAQFVDGGPWTPFVTCTNYYDLVPRAWSDLALAKTWYPKGQGPVANTEVGILLDEIDLLRKGNVYVQPDAGTVALNQDYGNHDPGLVEKTTADYLGQVAHQHANSTYLDLLGGTPVLAGPVVTAVDPTFGTGDTPVLVHGTGFTPGSVLDFGTIPCADWSVDPSGTLISATAPAGVGIVDVRVTNDLGTSPAVPLGRFAYDGPAPLVVGGVEPPRSREGKQVTVRGSGFVADRTTVRFKDTAGTGVMVQSATELTVTVPSKGLMPETVDITVAVGVTASPTAPEDEFTYEDL
ncbi:lipase family protein [Streptomyces dioscori]|nr:IPT/TIG domain-containing protein [Streptomyces dioscori]